MEISWYKIPKISSSMTIVLPFHVNYCIGRCKCTPLIFRVQITIGCEPKQIFKGIKECTSCIFSVSSIYLDKIIIFTKLTPGYKRSETSESKHFSKKIPTFRKSVSFRLQLCKWPWQIGKYLNTYTTICVLVMII